MDDVSKLNESLEVDQGILNLKASKTDMSMPGSSVGDAEAEMLRAHDVSPETNSSELSKAITAVDNGSLPGSLAPDSEAASSKNGSSRLCNESTQSSCPENSTERRRIKAREKQRANRTAKREAKRGEAKIHAASASNTEAKTEKDSTSRKRQRPSPDQRKMLSLIRMFDWPQMFLGNEAWLSYLRDDGSVSSEAVKVISEAVTQRSLNQKQSRTFECADDLGSFIDSKKKELSHIEDQLTRVSTPEVHEMLANCFKHHNLLDDNAEAPTSAKLFLDKPEEFLSYIIMPCLTAQLHYLKAVFIRASDLEHKYEGLHWRCVDQKYLTETINSLKQDQAVLLPACPVWKGIESEIKDLEAQILKPRAFSRLVWAKRNAQTEYQESLSLSCTRLNQIVSVHSRKRYTSQVTQYL